MKKVDRVEVRPIHKDGRVSWITCDPLFGDLDILPGEPVDVDCKWQPLEGTGSIMVFKPKQ